MGKPSTFIKLDRNILKWRWYQDPNTFRVFVHLLLMANVTDGSFEKITVHRGELITSYPKLSKELSISIQSVRTAISHLVETEEVTVKTGSKYSVISILNYDAYQRNQQAANRQKTGVLTECSQLSTNKSTGTLTGKSGAENHWKSKGSESGQSRGQQSNQQGNQQSANSQLTVNQQQLKNNKNIKNKKEYTRARETDSAFEGSPSSAAPEVGETVYFTNYRGDRVPHVWREKDAVRFKANGYTDVERYILEMT